MTGVAIIEKISMWCVVRVGKVIVCNIAICVFSTHRRYQRSYNPFGRTLQIVFVQICDKQAINSDLSEE